MSSERFCPIEFRPGPHPAPDRAKLQELMDLAQEILDGTVTATNVSMPSSKYKTIYLDMDGVIADFHGAARKVYPAMPSKEDWPGGEWGTMHTLAGCKSKSDFWLGIEASAGSLGGFWENIEPTPWADDLINLVRLNCERMVIATSPASDPASSYGKVAWLQRFFGADFRDYIIIAAGKERLASRDTLLIDDHDGNVESFAGAGGSAILLPAPWNKMHRHRSDPMSIAKGRLLNRES